MGASFLITLREGLEIAIVLAILLSYLVKSNRANEAIAVWRGAGSAAVLCLAAGVVIHLATGGLHGSAEKAVEMVIAAAAASVLTWMIFWMRTHSRSMGAELRQQVDEATTATALAAIAFVAVLREGLETALFLLSAENASSSGTSVVIGGLLGLAVAAVLGRLFYIGGNRINLRTFFNVTGILLILFAAGLVGKAFHEFREMMTIETGWIWQPVWTVESGVWSSGTFYDFMKGFFGWHAETERIRLIAYFAYLIPVGYLFLRGSRTTAPQPVETREPASTH
ncbi:MAG: FTR1 family iron permease [Ilumatobacteraceae bacterium]